MRLTLIMLCSATALTLAAAPASPAISYDVDFGIGAGSLQGSITTDGTLGVLSSANLSAWTLTINGMGASDVLTEGNSNFFVGGAKLTADANHIYFDFTHDDTNPAYVLVQRSFGTGGHYACGSNATYALTPCLEGTSAVPVTYNDPSASFGHPAGSTIIASTAAVPEPATWAMMILGLGTVGLAMRRRQPVAVSFA